MTNVPVLSPWIGGALRPDAGAGTSPIVSPNDETVVASIVESNPAIVDYPGVKEPGSYFSAIGGLAPAEALQTVISKKRSAHSIWR